MNGLAIGRSCSHLAAAMTYVISPQHTQGLTLLHASERIGFCAMTHLEQAEHELAAMFAKIPLEDAITLVLGGMTIAYGDNGLQRLQKECNRHLEEDETVAEHIR